MPLPPPPCSQPNAAVFLDLDGTLVEIAERPDLIAVTRDLVEALDNARARLGGALAVISGRTLDDLDRRLAPLQLPAAGIHGLEHRDAQGRRTQPSPAPLPERTRIRLGQLAAAWPAVLVENKGDSVAVHYRQDPSAGPAVRTAMEEIHQELGQDFVLQHGKMVIELRPAGASKGTAIMAFMAEPPFAGRLPVFVGDDVTDEDGFAVVNSLGGHSVRVGADCAGTAARFGLPDVAAVHDWLDRIGR
jgi:trehalose 6-phosphate phosphatase